MNKGYILLSILFGHYAIGQEKPTNKNESEKVKELEIVTVKAEKSSIETKMDKKIFNVGKDLVAKGGNATDVLNNVPSVNVSANGSISLRGNSSVRILINGKPSVLTQNNGLEQIPAETIERIEVITNPSAQYDAQGASGIINIILKKNKLEGFSSSFTLAGGLPNNNSVGVNMNYKKERFNLFSDFRFTRMTFFGDSQLNRTNLDTNSNPTSLLYQNTITERNSNRFNLYLGSDYYINDKNTLTLSYFFRHNVTKNYVDYNFDFKNTSQTTTQLVTANEFYREPQMANQIELNYVKTFDKKGKKITTNIQYDFWNDDENENITENEIIPNPSLKTLKSRDLESSKDFVFQSDITLPIREKTGIDLGVKGEIRNIDSDYRVSDNEIQIDTLTNVLRYQERIFGVYTQYKSEYKKFQYQLGLRAEHFKTGSTDAKNIFNTDKQYTQLFPTLHLTYNFKDNFSLQLSYSRRIDRPSFYQLNPFGGIADRRNIRIGNPDLNPMYINSYELGTLFKLEKVTINTSLYHQNSTNLFEISVSKNSSGYLVEKPINLGTENRYGIELNLTYSPISWWFISGDINWFKFEQKGLFNVNSNSWTSKINSRIKLKTWSLQNSFNFEGAITSGQTKSKTQFWANLALSKEFWKEKASFTLRGDNIFDSRIDRNTISGSNYTIYTERRFSKPRVSLSFVYKFNRKKNDKDRLPE